jgi:hypothetical protein
MAREGKVEEGEEKTMTATEEKNEISSAVVLIAAGNTPAAP